MTIIKPSFISLDEIDSTNNFVLQNFDTLESFCMVSAKKQTAGKGRRGNRWISSGENFYGTMLIKNPEISPGATGWVASLAAVESLKEFAPESNFWIKWPNDIYCGEKKICGILCEAKTDSANKIKGLALGIGVNLNMDEQECASIEKPATSLYLQSNNKICLNKYGRRLATLIVSMYNVALLSGEKAIFDIWKAENLLIGKKAELVTDDDGKIDGDVLDILPSGQLLFRPDGKPQIILNSGTVSIKSSAGLFGSN